MIESFGLTVMLFCSVNFVEDAISSIICCSEQLAKNNIIIIYTNQFFILNFLFFILTQHSIGLLGIVSSSISCFVCFMRIYQSFVCHIPRSVLIYLRPVIFLLSYIKLGLSLIILCLSVIVIRLSLVAFRLPQIICSFTLIRLGLANVKT